MASSGPIQPERKSFLFAPWRPVLDPVDARHCRLLSQIQLSTLVIGFIAICIPSWLDRGATLPRDPAALAAFAGLGLVLALYIVNRLGYVRFASAGTMLTLSVMVWQYPFLARHELSSWSYFYLALPVLLTDMLLSTPMLAFIIALNLLPMLVVPIVLPEISLDEMPIVFYAMASVFVVAGRRHRANLEAARQRELHASHERYRGLLEAAFEGVALEEGGVLRRVNAGFSRIFGCPAGAAPGKPLRAFIPDWGEGPREALRVYAGRAADGGERFVQVIARQLEDAPAAALMIGIRDVTAEKQFEAKRQQMEEQLQQTQKLESLGLLAGGIAHDFNNQLAAILGQASLLDMELPGGTPANEAARTIVRAAEQAASMTEKLLGFARQGKHQSVALDLHETLREVQVLLRHILDKNIEVACDAGAGNSRIKGDPVQLQQVFLNLAINARDAMPRGGRLLFRTENAELSSAPERAPAAAPGNYTVVRVSDTGCGIPAEVLPRIFDPFFTTKQVGQGTGLGLAMVYGIVQSHGGYIEVQSSAGGGDRVCRVPARYGRSHQSPGAGGAVYARHRHGQHSRHRRRGHGPEHGAHAAGPPRLQDRTRGRRPERRRILPRTLERGGRDHCGHDHAGHERRAMLPCAQGNQPGRENRFIERLRHQRKDSAVAR